jgi:hypothetical protein
MASNEIFRHVHGIEHQNITNCWKHKACATGIYTATHITSVGICSEKPVKGRRRAGKTYSAGTEHRQVTASNTNV